jgi:CrcB protein
VADAALCYTRSVRAALLVASGGMVGSFARYALAGFVQRLSDAPFPVGTLVVNVVGSFLLGLVMALSLERGALGAEARILLGGGFCGGFTTMSTFAYETMALTREGDVGFAIGNFVLTWAACLGAVVVGQLLGRGT